MPQFTMHKHTDTSMHDHTNRFILTAKIFTELYIDYINFLSFGEFFFFILFYFRQQAAARAINSSMFAYNMFIYLKHSRAFIFCYLLIKHIKEYGGGGFAFYLANNILTHRHTHVQGRLRSRWLICCERACAKHVTLP